MFTPLKNQKGRSPVEFLMVMVLLVLFAIAALTLVASGSKSYKSTLQKSDVESELRIAQSYIHTKIRQNQESGALTLLQFNGIEGDALSIRDIEYNSDFVTIIFAQGGMLYECLVEDGVTPEPELSFEICKIDRFELKRVEDSGFWISTSVAVDGHRESIDSFISILTQE